MLIDPVSLPNLQAASTVLMVSDYGGQHKTSPYEAFSFLFTKFGTLERWETSRSEIRTAYHLNLRRISYKALNDKRKRDALQVFLSAADDIPGLLVTVLVEKSLTRRLTITPEERSDLASPLSNRHTHVLKRLIHVAHFGSLFLAGLSAPGQNIVWFTDNDDIVSNTDQLIDTVPFIAAMVSSYTAHDLGHFRFGTTNSDDGSLSIEDLLAIPDLACGACCDIPYAVLRHTSRLRTPLRGLIPAKALDILGWLGDRRGALRKLTFCVDRGDEPSRARTRLLDLTST